MEPISKIVFCLGKSFKSAYLSLLTSRSRLTNITKIRLVENFSVEFVLFSCINILISAPFPKIYRFFRNSGGTLSNKIL